MKRFQVQIGTPSGFFVTILVDAPTKWAAEEGLRSLWPLAVSIWAEELDEIDAASTA